MAESMVKNGSPGNPDFKFQYNPSPPGEAEEIMNAVLSGLVKTERSSQFNERAPFVTSAEASNSHFIQPSRYAPYTSYHHQYYCTQSEPVSPTYYSQYSPFSSHYVPTHSSLPSIPSTVYHIQGSPPGYDQISDEQLDETLKDLGLLEPSRPKSSVNAHVSNHPTHSITHRHSLYPSTSCPSVNMSACKESQGQPRLYRFIMTLLENPETNPSLIEWVDRSKGMFALVDPNEIARRWGICKNNSCMNYEKMSRGFRYYYKVGILERVPGKKLVYKFSPRAPIWNMMSPVKNDKVAGSKTGNS